LAVALLIVVSFFAMLFMWWQFVGSSGTGVRSTTDGEAEAH
jgi:hypothetical protein